MLRDSGNNGMEIFLKSNKKREKGRQIRLTWWTGSAGWRRLLGRCWRSCCHTMTADELSSDP